MRTDDLSIFFELYGRPSEVGEGNIPGNRFPLVRKRLTWSNLAAILSSFAAYYERVYFGCERQGDGWDENEFGPHDLRHFDFTKGGGEIGSDFCDGQNRSARSRRLAEFHNLIALYKRLSGNVGWKFEIERPGWDDPYQISKEWICAHGILGESPLGGDIKSIGRELMVLGWHEYPLSGNTPTVLRRLNPLASLQGDTFFRDIPSDGRSYPNSKCLTDLLSGVWAGLTENNPNPIGAGGNILPCYASEMTILGHLDSVFPDFHRSLSAGISLSMNKRLTSAGVGILNQALAVTKKLIRSYDLRSMLRDANYQFYLNEVRYRRQFLYGSTKYDCEIDSVSIVGGEVVVTLKSPIRPGENGYLSEGPFDVDTKKVDAGDLFAFASISDSEGVISNLTISSATDQILGCITQEALERELTKHFRDFPEGDFVVYTRGGGCLGNSLVVDLSVGNPWTTDIELSIGVGTTPKPEDLSEFQVTCTATGSKSIPCRYSDGMFSTPEPPKFPGNSGYEHGVVGDDSCLFLFAKSVAFENESDGIGEVSYSKDGDDNSKVYLEEYSFDARAEFMAGVETAVVDTQRRAIRKVSDHVKFDITNRDEVYEELNTETDEIASLFPQEIDTLRADISFDRNVQWEGHWDGNGITWTSTITDDGTEQGFRSPPLFRLSSLGAEVAPLGSFATGAVDPCRASGRISMIQQIDFNFKSLNHS